VLNATILKFEDYFLLNTKVICVWAVLLK